MPCNLSERVGTRKPSYRFAPEYVETDGPDAATLSSGYGLSPDGWQADILDDWLGRNERGLYTSNTCGLAVARQNGKNGIIEMRELFGMVILGEKFLHTAHELKTAKKAFLRLCTFFENSEDYPELAELVETIRKANGQESITLKNGGSIEFSARTAGAGRGLTVDIVVCDEAQHLTDEQLSALIFTKSAAPSGDHQLIITGTPPTPSSAGDVFERIRKQAYDANDDSLCWHEWSVKDIGDVKDIARWYATNPALGGNRLNLSAIESEVTAMSPDSFARERLGRWATHSAKAAFEPSVWKRLASITPAQGGRICYGIKFSPDGATVALAAAVKDKDGISPPHVEIVEHRSTSNGTEWLAKWLIERKGKMSSVAIDGMSGAGALIEHLNRLGMPDKVVVVPRVRDVITASALFMNAVKSGDLTHFDQPALNDALEKASKRPIQTNGGYGFKSISADTDISILDAAVLAHWAILTTKRDPARKARLL